jgi:SagB-type dehydrogenase family enzyme
LTTDQRATTDQRPTTNDHDTLAPVHRYHDGTKHHFNRFARSLGYLDWASQPRPFRSFHGAPVSALGPRPDAGPETAAVGRLLRHALGLSAWKTFRGSKWSLRVNPSSGNLHPTEAYVVTGPIAGACERAAVYHYAPDAHALERRCAFSADRWIEAGGADDTVLVVLVSIHWREAWKYGERAFRYCQHDLGHAVAALSISAALDGRTVAMLPEWSQRDIAALVGVDRDEDFFEAEREEPGCILAVGVPTIGSRTALLDAVRGGEWIGRASQLSEDHAQWTFIDEIAEATVDGGRSDVLGLSPPGSPARPAFPAPLILQRRSALAFDPQYGIDADRFFRVLARTMPDGGVPWDALWWTPRIHLALFVHRVEGVEPGLYVLSRSDDATERLRAGCRSDFRWDRAHDTLPLFALGHGDCRALAQRVSCDQDIAGDGFFSLGMLADFDRSLREFGPSFYRHLFWESGVVGQMLYLAAEEAGVRGTGIGCFYDDPVHDVLGLSGHDFQSLYHFAVGAPVEDSRLTTEPGYRWEMDT